MLRELNINEMEMVSGGDGGSGDEIVVTEQQRPSANELYFFSTIGGLLGASVGAVFGTLGGGGGGSLAIGSVGAASGHAAGEAAGEALVEDMYDQLNAWNALSDEEREAIIAGVFEQNELMQEGCYDQCPW